MPHSSPIHIAKINQHIDQPQSIQSRANPRGLCFNSNRLLFEFRADCDGGGMTGGLPPRGTAPYSQPTNATKNSQRSLLPSLPLSLPPSSLAFSPSRPLSLPISLFLALFTVERKSLTLSLSISLYLPLCPSPQHSRINPGRTHSVLVRIHIDLCFNSKQTAAVSQGLLDHKKPPSPLSTTI